MRTTGGGDWDGRLEDDELALRRARPGEEARLGDVAFRAFRMAHPELWTAGYAGGKEYIDPECTVVADGPHGIAGHATALRLSMPVAGRDLPMAGIAAVAVVPEARRRGVADRLMRECLELARERGDVSSLLYPFSWRYYARFGYAPCESVELVSVPPSDLPASPLRRRVRRLDRPRDETGVRAVYQAWRRGRTGPFDRGDAWWAHRVWARVPEGVVFDDGEGGVGGYLLYEVPQDGSSHAACFRVREWIAPDAAARAGLLGFLQALGEQFERVEMTLPAGAARTLTSGMQRPPETGPDHRQFDHLGYLGGGAMGRIVDLGRALSSHPGAAGGGEAVVGLDLDDPVFLDQSGPFDVTFGPGGARAVPGRRAPERLTLDVGRLSQVVLGAVSATRLLDEGLIHGSRTAATALDARFRGPDPHLLPLNGF